MYSRFIEKFKRVTDNHAYLPEIDGLRFLAVFLVVVIMHITHYLDEKFFNSQMIQSSYWKDFVMEGNNGVSLFFMISGFILSLPFAKWHLHSGKKVQLRHYYLRRLIRIEPPYLIVLLLAFMAHLWLLHIYPSTVLYPSFFSSVIYSHLLIYQDFPYILPVAWSLEIEVQFYLLAPLFCLVFLIKNNLLRRLLLVTAILINGFFIYHGHTIINVFVFLHFFSGGLLLADLYTTNKVIFRNQKVGLMIGLSALFALLFLGSINNIGGYYIKLVSIFLLMHTVLTNAVMKRIFSMRLLTIIGGMCYSIYLIHFAVISLTGKIFLRYSLASANKLYFIPYLVLFAAIVIISSAVYFLLVEKPFMKLGISQRRSVIKEKFTDNMIG